MYTGMIIRSEFDHREKETKGNHEMSYVDLKSKAILVTGAAGFIGSNLVKRLYEDVESWLTQWTAINNFRSVLAPDYYFSAVSR